MSILNKTKFTLAALSLCVSSALSAQDLAIVGAMAHTMSDKGVIENATILVEDGKIKSVKKGGRVPKGYKRIDAAGKFVTPGIIGAKTSLGLVEVEYSAGITDNTVSLEDDSVLGLQTDVKYAINPDSSLMDITRIEGVTTALSSIAYHDTLFGGQAAMITLGDKVNPVLKGGAVMTMDISGAVADEKGGSRAILWPRIVKLLEEANGLDGKMLGKDDDHDGDLSKEDANIMVSIMTGKMPLLIEVHRLMDIRHLTHLKSRYPDMKMVLLGATEAWRIADELAKLEIGVVLNPLINLPYDFEQLGATIENAARLNAAGVKVALGATSGVNTHNPRLAMQQAGNAHAHGMPWEDALESITINVAELFGMADEMGSLEKGKRADIVVWSGDPLEVMSFAENVIIGGEEMPMTSRQTKLRDRYLNMQNDVPYRYIKPN